MNKSESDSEAIRKKPLKKFTVNITIQICYAAYLTLQHRFGINFPLAQKYMKMFVRASNWASDAVLSKEAMSSIFDCIPLKT